MSLSTAPVEEYQASDPANDHRAFRGALGQYGTGVAVITTMSGGVPVGMTVSSFAAVSLDPPLILWSVQNSSRRAEIFTGAKEFAVNVLSAQQVAISRNVASPDAGTDPFQQFQWTEGLGGAPLIDGALARFECRAYEVLPGGDHQIIMGRVSRCTVMEGEPLLFVQGTYATSEPFPSTAEGTGNGIHESPDSTPVPFVQLVTAVNHRLSLNFDEYRSCFGLTVASSRVLKRLSAGPLTVDDLVASAFLAPQAIEDALSELIEANLVQRDGLSFHQTPSGRAVRQQVAANADRFSSDALAGLPGEDVKAAHRVLSALARNSQNTPLHHTKENAR